MKLSLLSVSLTVFLILGLGEMAHSHAQKIRRARTPRWAKSDGCATRMEDVANADIDGAYRVNIGEFPLLSAPEEKKLARAIARGKKQREAWTLREKAKGKEPVLSEYDTKLQREALSARNRLVESNLRLVMWVVKNHFLGQDEFMILVSHGNLGLFEAAHRYDPSFGTRFSTYATFWIKQSIRRELHNTSTTIRIPSYMHTLLYKLSKVKQQLSRGGDLPTDEEVNAAAGVKNPDLVAQARTVGSPVHFDQTGRDDDEGSSYEPVWQGSSAESDLIEEEDVKRARACLDEVLDDWERSLLVARYGLNHNEPQTIAQIAETRGVTKDAVRKTISRAIEKIEHRLTDKAFEDEAPFEDVLQRAG